MEKRVPSSILLMLSLEAVLVVAGLSAAAASSSDMDITIRLPSSDTRLGFADKQATATATATAARPGDDEERPWKCCDSQICTRTLPAICWCRDRVEQCPDACKECAEVGGDPQDDPRRYVCMDRYMGEPAPTCNKVHQENHAAHGGPGIADQDSAATVAAAAAGKE